jgi:Spy/CpxP family protein refolding chaperone
MKRLVLLFALAVSAAAFAQPVPPTPPAPPMPPMPPPPGGFFHGTPGIPPQVAAKLGIPAETVKKVQQLGFDANDQLITLEAELKRAQLDMERAMAEPKPDENSVLTKLERVSRAELAVRKNRVSLMLKIRGLLGPDLWSKLEAELPMMGEPGMGPGHREVRIIRRGDGTGMTQEEIHGP